MRNGFAAAGFQVLTDSKYLTSSAYLMPGDILLNDYDHTCINLGIGSYSGYKASSTTNYNTSRLTTKEIQTILKAIGWSNLAVDNSYGSKTIAAVKEFQKLYGLTSNGITDANTAKAMDIAYAYLKTQGFDAAYYSKTYPDLKKAYGTDLKLLLAHYYKYGKKEGRKIKASSSSKTAASTKATTTTKKTTTTTTKQLTYNTTGNYSKVPKKHGTVTTNLLNVRKGPGTNYANLNSYPMLAYGNEVDVCDMVKRSDGIWYYIRIAGKYFGFVHGNWLKITNL